MIIRLASLSSAQWTWSKEDKDLMTRPEEPQSACPLGSGQYSPYKERHHEMRNTSSTTAASLRPKLEDS